MRCLSLLLLNDDRVLLMGYNVPTRTQKSSAPKPTALRSKRDRMNRERRSIFRIPVRDSMTLIGSRASSSLLTQANTVCEDGIRSNYSALKNVFKKKIQLFSIRTVQAKQGKAPGSEIFIKWIFRISDTSMFLDVVYKTTKIIFSKHHK